jgi:hypothetical protein
MRAPPDTIPAPEFSLGLSWLGGRPLRMDRLKGRPVLIEFWDLCRANSMRTLPYMRVWHERYGHAEKPADGAARQSLQVIGIHSPGFEPSRERAAVQAARERLQIRYPIVLDGEMEMWRVYENVGWPARYLFDQAGMLFHYHYGEGAYEETELAIQRLLGVEREPAPPLRPEDVPGAMLAPQTEDQPGAYCGPYEAGGVWGVFDGEGLVEVNGGPHSGGGELQIADPGAYALVEHERHTRATLRLRVTEGLRCLQTCFVPGVS